MLLIVTPIQISPYMLDFYIFISFIITQSYLQKTGDIFELCGYYFDIGSHRKIPETDSPNRYVFPSVSGIFYFRAFGPAALLPLRCGRCVLLRRRIFVTKQTVGSLVLLYLRESSDRLIEAVVMLVIVAHGDLS